MALGYPSHDNVTRMHKLFPKVARERLTPISIRAKHRGAMCYDRYKRLPGFDLALNKFKQKQDFADILAVLYVRNSWSKNTTTSEENKI